MNAARAAQGGGEHDHCLRSKGANAMGKHRGVKGEHSAAAATQSAALSKQG